MNFTLRFKVMLLAILVLLTIPLLAMQYTKQVNWDLADFLAMALILLSLASSIEWVFYKFSQPQKQFLGVSLSIILAIIVWLILALDLC